ncbi:MAG: cyclodeaminase/cyclohydrolase family protein [Acidobacteria bacterium]|nr:cyclodeaminase/cyclohydrolase family protein [Acidobacteriota bacterium]
MPRFADVTVSAFIDALANSEPTPGGGTAAAVAGAMGTSLLMMVAGLAKTRTNADTEKALLGQARAALTSVRGRMLALADSDSDAFDQVMAAFRLPKGSEDEKGRRNQAIQIATRAATDAPLETLRTAAEAMQHARTIATHGNRSAVSDVRVALELLEAAAAGATANVETNLITLEDESYRKATASAVIDLTNGITETAAAARAAL